MRPILRVLQTAGALRASLNATSYCCNSKRAFVVTSAVLDTSRLYTKKHEWISVNERVGTVGISRFAQDALGDVVYVETPAVGQKLAKGESTGAIESVKAASDVYAPVSGTVVEKNTELDSKPFLINKSTYEKGWLYKLEVADEAELKDLMDENSYEAFCKEEQSAEE